MIRRLLAKLTAWRDNCDVRDVRLWLDTIAELQNDLRDRNARVAELQAALDISRAEAAERDRAVATMQRVSGWWREAQAERDEARQDVEDLQAARDREQDRANSLRAELHLAQERIREFGHAVDAATEIEARFDAGRLSAQGAFERLLEEIKTATGGGS